MRDVTPASAASVVMPSNVSPGPVAVHRLEVVEAPGAVEAELLGELHAADDLVPRHPLLGDIESESHGQERTQSDGWASLTGWP